MPVGVGNKYLTELYTDIYRLTRTNTCHSTINHNLKIILLSFFIFKHYQYKLYAFSKNVSVEKNKRD